MRSTAMLASAAVFSLTAALVSGTAANAADPTCTAYLLNDRTTFAMTTKSAQDRKIHFVSHLYESTPGCFTTFYGSDDYPGRLAFDNQRTWDFQTNYVGGGERDVTVDVPYDHDGVVLSWAGSSRQSYDDETDPGYLNPNSGTLDVRGQGYARVRVSTSKGARSVVVTATRYSNKAQANVPWSRARVQVQILKKGVWTTVKSAVANPKGVVEAVVRGKQSFRAVAAQSDVAWGATSKTVKR